MFQNLFFRNSSCVSFRKSPSEFLRKSDRISRFLDFFQKFFQGFLEKKILKIYSPQFSRDYSRNQFKNSFIKTSLWSFSNRSMVFFKYSSRSCFHNVFYGFLLKVVLENLSWIASVSLSGSPNVFPRIPLEKLPSVSSEIPRL